MSAPQTRVQPPKAGRIATAAGASRALPVHQAQCSLHITPSHSRRTPGRWILLFSLDLRGQN